MFHLVARIETGSTKIDTKGCSVQAESSSKNQVAHLTSFTEIKVHACVYNNLSLFSFPSHMKAGPNPRNLRLKDSIRVYYGFSGLKVYTNVCIAQCIFF
jgi:hypothetical protein